MIEINSCIFTINVVKKQMYQLVNVKREYDSITKAY